MKTSTRKLTLSALFLALGLVLPLITGQIPQIGKMLLPMHIPVLLCGMVCGWPYGLAVGAVMPLLRGLLFGMPVLYPTGIGMAFELAAYGAVIGLLYAKLNKRGVAGVYMALVPAMLAGRAVWGVAQTVLLGLGGSEHGVDSLTAPKAPAGLAATLAQKLGCVVLLSGTEDLIADGQQLCTVRGGSDRMRTVTGAGCMLSVLCGAFAAVQPGDAFTAAVQAARFWKACAEQAEDHAAGAGSFRVALFDAAGNMTDEVFAGE